MPRSFARDVRGNSAVLFGLCLTVLTSAVGIAIDYTRAATSRTELQKALDASALAATIAKGTDTVRRTAALAAFAANFTDTTLTPAVAFAGSDVTVSASYGVETTVAGVTGTKVIPIAATATARSGAGDPTCVILLDTNGTSLYGNSGGRMKADCGVQVNSSSGEALFVNSGGSVEATTIKVVGRTRNNGGTIAPAPVTNSPALADPLASLPEPPAGACTYTDMVVNNGEKRTLSPATFCQKLTINSGGTLHLNPGTYHLKDAEFVINSGAKVTGGEVTLYFSGEKGTLNVNSGSLLQISAPKTGTYKGIAIFQSRAAATLTANPHIVNSHSDSFIEGTVYAPTGKFVMNSDSNMNAAAKYTYLILRRLELNSYGTLLVKNDYTSGTPLPDGLKSVATGGSAHLVF